MQAWRIAATILFVGYLSFSRSFAYLGLPEFGVFIGEISLAIFILLRPQIVLGTLLSTINTISIFTPCLVILFVFLVYGTMQVWYGIVEYQSVTTVFKFFIFNYYALFLFLGMWIGIQVPSASASLVRCVAWVNGIYGLVYLIALKDVSAVIPGSGGVPFVGLPLGSMVAILGLLCVERDLRAAWLPLALNLLVLLAMQQRSEWLGLAVGALVWSALLQRLGRICAFGLAGLALLGLVQLADVQIGGRMTRSDLHGVSLDEVVARAVAPISVDLARQFSPRADIHAGTAEWREKWWTEIWASVHASWSTTLFGLGYGFDLMSVAPEDVRSGQEDVRTPHSTFFFALGYTGWIGVILFYSFQLSLVALLWRSFRITGSVIGLVLWSGWMAWSSFDSFFDTPMRAIPFYLLIGMEIVRAHVADQRHRPTSAVPTGRHREEAGSLARV